MCVCGAGGVVMPPDMLQVPTPVVRRVGVPPLRRYARWGYHNGDIPQLGEDHERLGVARSSQAKWCAIEVLHHGAPMGVGLCCGNTSGCGRQNGCLLLAWQGAELLQQRREGVYLRRVLVRRTRCRCAKTWELPDVRIDSRC